MNKTSISEKGRKTGFNPVWPVLQGLFIIGIGIFLVMISGGHYQENTGHIQNIFVFSNDNMGGWVTYLQISADPNDLYVFDTSALHPAWTGQFSKNARVDVYYSDGTPKRVVALQMYDLSGHPTTKYTTTDYTNSQNASPISNFGLDIGVILLLLGTVWTGAVIFMLVRTRRQ